jgi:hypothetical protein
MKEITTSHRRTEAIIKFVEKLCKRSSSARTTWKTSEICATRLQFNWTEAIISKDSKSYADLKLAKTRKDSRNTRDMSFMNTSLTGMMRSLLNGIQKTQVNAQDSN